MSLTMNSDKEVLDDSKITEKKRWKKLKSALGHVGLLIALVVYTVSGGLIFRELEHPAEVTKLAKLRKDVLQSRHEMIYNVVNNTDLSNLATLVSLELETYELAVQEAVKKGFSFPLDVAARPRWNFIEAVFFASTVITTIGYGNLVPQTLWGQLFYFLYALIGIPLTLMVMADMGHVVAMAVSWLADRIRGHVPVDINLDHVNTTGKRSLFALAAVFFLHLYLAAGAGLFMLWEEDWGFFEGFYFCFTTMTTIGFGDLVPTKPKYMLLCTAYILIGLALTSTIIDLVRKQYAQSWKQLQALSGPLADSLRRLGESAGGSIDVAALHRMLTVISTPKFSKGGGKSTEEWEKAMAAVLRDITSTPKKKQPVIQIVIYESSV